MKPLVTDALGDIVAPLLPRRRAQPKGGRPWVDDRATLNGILYLLRTGIPWKLLATELGYGSGATCWPSQRGKGQGPPVGLRLGSAFAFPQYLSECSLQSEDLDRERPTFGDADLFAKGQREQ